MLIDEETWGKDLDPDEPEGLTPEMINGHILYNTQVYAYEEWEDYDLREHFTTSFQGWTKELFDKAKNDLVIGLRDQLRIHGVFIAKDGKSVAGNISKALEGDFHEWTDPEVEYMLKTTHIFKSSFNPNRNQNQAHNQQQQIRPTQLTPQDTPVRSHTPIGADNTPRLLTDLTKLYNDDKRFGGELYDIFDSKYKIFCDDCTKIGLPEYEWHKSFSTMLKGRAAMYYYDRMAGYDFPLSTMTQMMKDHFHTEENRQFYLSEWRETTFPKLIGENPGKSRLEVLQILFDKLQDIQRGLSVVYQQEVSLRDQILNACRGVEECSMALFKPATTYEGVCSDLRSAIGAATRNREARNTHQFLSYSDNGGNNYGDSDENGQYWTDRTYGGSGRWRGRNNFDHQGRYSNPRGNSRRGNLRPSRFSPPQSQTRQKKCYVCNEPNCWSTRHTIEERRKAFDKFRQSTYMLGTESTVAAFQSFLTEFEGVEGLDDQLDETQQLLMDLELENEDQFFTEQYHTEFGDITGTQTVAFLNDQSVFHAVTGIDMFSITPKPREDNSIFTFEDRYSAKIFQGIMPDTGAAGVSTAGQSQSIALQQLDSSIKIDSSTAGQHQIRFGKGEAVSIGTLQVPTPLGTITFHVIPTNTPFLLCLRDMDNLKIKFDNLDNVLIQNGKRFPIVRKWGHPWLLLNRLEQSIAWSHLTETELRQLHRRFGHPSVRRLSDLLQRAGHEVEVKMIEHLAKYCHQCQMNSKAPGRFKFTLRDDFEFNFEIIIDVMYIDGKPVLHIVDTATAFQAARFLKDMSAKTAWDTLKLCWIDTYLGPPDYIVHDAGKNFISTEFKRNARSLSIEVKEIPVEAHNSIGKVERYHAPLRRAFETIRDDIPDVSPEIILQMAVKAVNDTAGPNGLVPTLLVFGAYPRMTNDSPPSPSITQRAEAVRKAMKEVRHLHAERQVKDALTMRNGPNTTVTTRLPPNSDVRVWRDKANWTGPFKLIASDGETCTVQMPYGPTNFRSTVVKPYYTNGTSLSPNAHPEDDSDKDTPETGNNAELDTDQQQEQPIARRGRGRPKGSKNKSKTHVRFAEDINDTIEDEDFDDYFITALNDGIELTMTFMSSKEESDRLLALKLRQEKKITTPGEPFELSDKKEIDTLISNGVFRFEQYDATKHGKPRIFESRLVREIKGKATDTPYEKSRLVIQGYQDNGKSMILTQSPTIQRASQRVIMTLAPSLMKLPDRKISLWLRDITQAYVQSQTKLNRLVLAHLPKEIAYLYPEGTIMVVVKPLYGLAEAGTHWWATYSKHHRERLMMTTSTYDPCFLITTSKDKFGLVGMQTDDTIILADEQFSTLEEKELIFLAKPKEKLTPKTALIFNGCILTRSGDELMLRQKEQGKKIELIDADTPDFQQKYVEQRARGAYIATICQPEAAFDLSVAAQNKEPTKEDITALNKRLQWQLDHLDRGLKNIPLDLSTAKLFVFVDGSFANNKDLSSQIGYIIAIANETTGTEEFTIQGNVIHWSSTKSKRVTRSVLASEIYGMVGGVDMTFVITSTLNMIMDQLNLPTIPMIVCTDSYSLYECIVKLGSTKEKRLMIDIIALRQMYERREMFDIRWINGHDNPADAMTKSAPNKSLETFLDTNSLRIRVEGWVKREQASMT
ncbi:MAG TPA: hypothetical protein VGI71_23255 [Scandinavium sp.]|jgi:hypothetical protein